MSFQTSIFYILGNKRLQEMMGVMAAERNAKLYATDMRWVLYKCHYVKEHVKDINLQCQYVKDIILQCHYVKDHVKDIILVRTIQLFRSRINIPKKDANCINITCLVKGSHRAALLCLAGQVSHVSSKGITFL